LIDRVGVVTEPDDSRMAFPLVRVTTPVVEMLKVVADVPRIVVPKVGAVAGERVTEASAMACRGAANTRLVAIKIERANRFIAAPRQ